MSFAFFDFDKTIIHGDAGPLFGTHLFERRRRKIQERDSGPARAAGSTLLWTGVAPYLAWMTVQTALYKLRAVRRSTVTRAAYKGLKGVPVHLLESELAEFVDDEIVPRIYPEVLAEMKANAKAGTTNVIITTGMETLVSSVLPYLPAGTKLIGCELEEKDGRLTGRIVQGPLYGQDKANIILAYCKAAGIEPESCSAFSDHYSDHHMLKAVGRGVCINPAARLSKMAKQEGWEVWRLADPRGRRKEKKLAA